MKRTGYLLLLVGMAAGFAWGGQYRSEVKPTKNLIVMIPDGTSMGVVSSSRWLKVHGKKEEEKLALDPYLCGTVKTFCSNAPIGDSAPTTSCYMTGMPQQAGNVAIYPRQDEGKDLVPVDPARTYQPLATVLEAMKYYGNKATGLVVTCEFPHATPADCSAHYYNRGVYECIAPQMAYNNLDVMFGGGVSILTDDIRKHFSKNGTTLFEDDASGFRAYKGDGPVWALFCSKSVPYDLDRDDSKVPSLAEMTKKALEQLSRNENGFFLMVEGSKIDFAAHANDAVGCLTEFLAFDKAVKEAIEFAKKDGQTTVVILPDHGNSGFSLGNAKSNKGYALKSIDELFSNVAKYKKTGEGLARILLKTKPADMAKTVREYTDIELKPKELETLLSSSDYKMGDKGRKGRRPMHSNLIDIMNDRTYFGFTTGGHTGEDVFLAVYHPQGTLPLGMNTNQEINQYLCDVAGLEQGLDQLTNEIFAKHTDVFAGLDYSVKEQDNGFATLTVKKGDRQLKVPSFKSVVELDGKEIPMKSVAVYIDKNKTFYLPRNLKDLLDK